MSVLTTSEAGEYLGLAAGQIYDWRKRGKITPAGRHGREVLWPADTLIELEAVTHRRRAGQDGRCRARNAPTNARGSVPGSGRVAHFPGVTMPPNPDPAAVPLAEGQMVIPLPNGNRLRVDIAVMPDLETVAVATVMPAREAS